MKDAHSFDYKSAGVDREKAETLVETFRSVIDDGKRDGTSEVELADVDRYNIGGFAGVRELKSIVATMKDPVLVATTDGIGTKLSLALEHGRLDDVGQDLVAMCTNDLLTRGAIPCAFLDYIAAGTLVDQDVVVVVRSIQRALRVLGCPLLGGETAEMPGVFMSGQFDIAGFAVGFVDRDLLVDKRSVCEGDVIVGIASSGLHANGYSLVRQVLKHHAIDVVREVCDNKTLLDLLLAPTTLYTPIVKPLLTQKVIHSMANVTGGGLVRNIPRAIPFGLEAVVDHSAWPWPSVCTLLCERGPVDVEEMRRTFNCGIGFCLVVAKHDASAVVDVVRTSGVAAYEIGSVRKGSGTLPIGRSP